MMFPASSMVKTILRVGPLQREQAAGAFACPRPLDREREARPPFLGYIRGAVAMDETQVVTFARQADFELEPRIHCLETVEGMDLGRIFILNAHGTTVGRSPPAEIVLNDSEVSRAHCRLAAIEGALLVADLNSTNGTFVDGVRVTGTMPMPVGAILRVGRQSLKHEWRTEREILQHQEFEREIRKASAY